MSKLFFLGAGKMATAIAGGIVKAEVFQKAELAAFDVSPKAAAEFEQKTGVRCYWGGADSLLFRGKDGAEECGGALRKIVEQADAVLLAVKPQVLPSLYLSLREIETGLWISIAAGVPLSVLEDHLGTDNIVRFMPNIAARTRRSVTAVAAGDGVGTDNRSLALAIATSFGSAYFISEELFPAFIGISGSGIAYMLGMMHHMAMGGVKAGIPYPEALSIVRDTMSSAAELQKGTGKGAIDLETMVCSAAGTTIEGVKALEDKGFGSALMKAVQAAADKSIELEAKAH